MRLHSCLIDWVWKFQDGKKFPHDDLKIVRKQVPIKGIKNGYDIFHFKNMNQAALYLKVSPSKITYVLKNNLICHDYYNNKWEFSKV